MQRISLNGEWEFVVDLDPKYHREPFYAQPEYDRRNWRKVQAPGVWNHYGPELDIYEGVCWFARKFQIDSLPEEPICRLRFGGVNYLCEVFLNGEPVGGHEGGYTEFTCDVAGKLKTGDNILAVKVDNRATSTVLPHVLGYFNYGGIHRDVALEIGAVACLDDVFMRAVPAAEGNGNLDISGKVTGRADSLRVTAECKEAKAEVTVQADGAFTLSLDVSDVSPWSPDSPNLYPVKIELRSDSEYLDRHKLQAGFRSVETANQQILLNGEPILLKGICYVYDSPEYGLMLHPEQVKRDIGLLKEMGVNTIRSHFPFSREFYETCDREGILVWIEPPVYCMHPGNDETGTIFADPHCRSLALSMLEEMIAHARNHPSVVVYGIGNECNLKNKEAEVFFRCLAERVRELDTTRIVSYACLYGNVGAIGDMVDVIGINQYWGWYDRLKPGGGPLDGAGGPANLEPLEQLLEKLSRESALPLLLTEFGADSVPGFRSKDLELWSEDYHAYLLQEIMKLARRYPAVCGTFPFCFSDYRDPSKYVGTHWNGVNLKGVVTHARVKKAAFQTITRNYRES